MTEWKQGPLLENMSIEELQAEINKRKEEERVQALPKPTLAPNLKPLQIICQKYVEDFSQDGWVNDDATHFIFEKAMETVFDKEVWDFINSLHRKF